MSSVDEIALAALLHDVGGLSFGYADPPTGLDGSSRAASTAGMITRHQRLFAQAGLDTQWLAQTSSRHHNSPKSPADVGPESPAAWAILYANRYAGGTDPSEESLKRAPLAPLLPVFSQIALSKGARQTGIAYPFNPFAAATGYPVDGNGANRGLEGYRGQLARHLEGRLLALAKLKVGDARVLLANLLGLLQEVGWCVPADTRQEGVSLFDHLRLSAAIASALWAYHLASERGQPTVQGLSDEGAGKFLLAVGDLGGIQDHIYQISSAQTGTGGLAKRLRARSLEVSLSTEALALEVLEALELPPLQRIMSAGGKFYLLLPNTQRAHEVLQESRQRWEAYSLSQGATLIPNLAWTAFAPGEFWRFQAVVQKAHGALAEVKTRPFQSQLQDPYLVFNKLTPTPRPCKAYSGLPAAERGRDPEFSWQATRDKYVGTELPKLAEPALSLHRPEHRGDTVYPFPRASFDLGARGHYVLRGQADFSPAATAWEVRPLLGHLPAVRDALRLPAFENDLERYREWFTDRGFADEERGEPDLDSTLSFSELAELSEGVSYLGALMLDADRMGEVFARGFDHLGKSSPSRMATLSRMLENFFALEVATLIKEPQRYAARLSWSEGDDYGQRAWKVSRYPLIYSVYSGGDDLFLLGPWDVLLEFALDLNRLYGHYTGNHPDFSLSGGFTMVRPHLPVPQLSELVKTLEQEAKAANKTDSERRGHLALFSQAIPWQSLPDVKHWAKKLRSDFAAKRVSKAQVYRWLQLHRDYRRWQRTDAGRAMRYKPLLAYALRPHGQHNKELYEHYGDLLNHTHPAWSYLPAWVQWGLYAQREDL